MSLKYKVDSLEGLDEATAALYEKSGEKYVLRVEGLDNPDDVAGLKKQVEDLLSEKKAAAQKAKDAEEAARKAAEEAARKAGDTEALEKSWRQKLAKREDELNAQIEERNQWIHQQTVQSTAAKIAADLAIPGSADVLLPHVQRFVGMEVRDGKPTAIVLDEAGKPSADSFDDLKKRFQTNGAFAPLIVASKASGGGANGANKSGGAAPKTASRADFEGWKPDQKSKFIRDGGTVIDS